MPTLHFTTRDLRGLINVDYARWTVTRLRWRDLGGCWDGRLRAEAAPGAPAALSDLTGLLRCGVEVQGERGPAWWGYVHAVTLHADGQATTLTLDGLCNRARAVYRRPGPPGLAAAECWTDWQVDAASVAQWGSFERVLPLREASGTLSEASDAQAEAAAAAALAGQPQRRAEPSNHTGSPYAELEIRGWWRALEWETFAEPRGWQGHDLPADDTLHLGDSPAQTALAQWFSAAGSYRLKEVWLRVAKVRALDGLKLEVVRKAGAGTLLAETSLPASSIGDGLAWARFTLPGAGVALDDGAAYWLRLWRTGALDSAQYYRVAADQGQSFGGELWRYDGSAWSLRSPSADLPFWLVGVDDTLAQAGAMLRGQFTSAVRIDAPGGVDGALYRAGRRDRRSEAEALLRAANLLADFDSARAARVRAAAAAPAASAAPAALLLRAGPGAQILDVEGRPLPLCGDLAGARLALHDSTTRLEWVTWENGLLRAGA